MYAVMYLNVYEWDHVYFSLTRVYMALLMLVPMTLIMMGFMWSMYPDKQRNALIMGGSLMAFVVVLTMVRSQTFVGDTLWMKAMIPHHSIAIMVSKRATIKDPEVRQLADSIISAQEREIGPDEADAGPAGTRAGGKVAGRLWFAALVIPGAGTRKLCQTCAVIV